MAFLDQYQKELLPIVEKIGMANSAAMEICTGYFNAHQDEDWVSMAKAKLEDILANQDINKKIAAKEDRIRQLKVAIQGVESSPATKLRKLEAEEAELEKKLKEVSA
jgi:hypothetical protein